MCRIVSVPVYFPPGSSGVSNGVHSISHSPTKYRMSNSGIISLPVVGPPWVAPGWDRCASPVATDRLDTSSTRTAFFMLTQSDDVDRAPDPIG